MGTTRTLSKFTNFGSNAAYMHSELMHLPLWVVLSIFFFTLRKDDDDEDEDASRAQPEVHFLIFFFYSTNSYRQVLDYAYNNNNAGTTTSTLLPTPHGPLRLQPAPTPMKRLISLMASLLFALARIHGESLAQTSRV